MICDTLAQMYINRVEWYLMDQYDVYVSFDPDGADEYWFDPETDETDPGVISIDNKKSAVDQLYTLLHESGHVSLRVNPESFRSKLKVPDRMTLGGRLEILREEVLAWDRAEWVAKQLNIPLDRKSWSKSYMGALEKYTRWALEEIVNEE